MPLRGAKSCIDPLPKVPQFYWLGFRRILAHPVRKDRNMFPDRVATLCMAELGYFRNGTAKEWEDPHYKRVGEYWTALGYPGRDGRTDVTFKTAAKGKPVLSRGQPVPLKNKNPAWSAAFISYIARQAGAGARFPYSAFHSRYILDAISKADGVRSDMPWFAQHRTGYAPIVGDLIACGRGAASNATFETAPGLASAGGFFESHTDFVVETGKGYVKTIGGNVLNSVLAKTWKTDKNGMIGKADPISPTSKVICVIECLIDKPIEI
jgi:hypothetical protein